MAVVSGREYWRSIRSELFSLFNGLLMMDRSIRVEEAITGEGVKIEGIEMYWTSIGLSRRVYRVEVIRERT